MNNKKPTQKAPIEFPVHPNDFLYQNRGTPIATLTAKDLQLLKPINQLKPGKQRALLLLHGFSSSPAVYRYLIPQLEHYNAIVCPLLKGHGQSIQAFAVSSADDWLASAHQACELLIQEYQEVDVLGLSLGGLLAYELSHSFSLNHLFLLAPALKLRMNLPFNLGLMKILKSLGFCQLRNHAGNLITKDRAEIAYKTVPLPAIIEILSFIQNQTWTPPTCPIDLFLGREDEVVDVKALEEQFLPLSNATIHWLEHSAHSLPLDNDYQLIIDCINDHSIIHQLSI